MKHSIPKSMIIFTSMTAIVVIMLGTRRLRVVCAASDETNTAHITQLPYIANSEDSPEYLPDSQIHHVTFFSPKTTTSSEAMPRNGILTLRKNAKGTLLICHGYMCSKHDIAFIRTLFPDFNSFVFDFRAHGEQKDNQCCTLGKYEPLDIMAAVNFLRNHPKTKHQKLFGYGFSMGAVSLIQAQAQKKQFDGLILDCPFDSSVNVLSRLLDGMNISLLGFTFDLPARGIIQKYAFHPYVEPFVRRLVQTTPMNEALNIDTKITMLNPAKSMKKIDIPCFFIHCKNDEKVSVAAAKKLYDNANGIKRLWITNGRRHFDSYFYNPEKYAYYTNKFLSMISGRLSRKEPLTQVIIDKGT